MIKTDKFADPTHKETEVSEQQNAINEHVHSLR